MGKNLIFLGLGLILAAILTWNSNTLSEAEVIERARELGMVFIEEVEHEIQSQLDNKSNIELEEDSTRETKKIIHVEIPAGASAQRVANILTDEGFDGSLFLEEVYNKGVFTKIKYGSYEIDSDATIEEIIKLMTN